ncbi:MAG: hypothetical protein A2X49_10580 [Lentisphaerae bacterium GWF2_52_8]|nr:MAG: hypothetical protein A2X49_10580 [Lentisphaerae bacterium GWF2_52_8]
MGERYQSIARRLLAEIESGLYRKGELLPTRTELSLRFEVARATVDRAVALLIRRGILESSRGSGTLVALSGRNYRLAVVGADSGLVPKRLVPKNCCVEFILPGDLASKSERASLRAFDGIIWAYPEKAQLDWSRELPSAIPQILVNRDVEGFNYVSTDHRGAIRKITAERLALCPDGLPVFFRRSGSSGIVWEKREGGFVDACRDVSRFYEVINLPESFAERIETLDKHFPSPLKKPLILVSGALHISGAAISWVRQRGFLWRKEVFYSDFDNEYPEDVWGLRCTSFIQDYDKLFWRALEGIISLIDGTESSVRVLVPPKRVDGDT